eukprot:GHVU01071138.1.p2 GENE.GHVU01071138.1~~GHVU01071138.1.p2  ORF type:complete len:125 (+),score=21.30 GHVU01071138.1:176-550(+)
MTKFMLGQTQTPVEGNFDSGSSRCWVSSAVVDQLQKAGESLRKNMLPHGIRTALTANLQKEMVESHTIVLKVIILPKAEEPLTIEEVPFLIFEEPANIVLMGIQNKPSEIRSWETEDALEQKRW